MNEKNSKIIAIAFIAVIFLFGSTTLLKCKEDLKSILEFKDFTVAKTGIEDSIQENFKSKNNWINLNGLFQKSIGMTIVNDAGGTHVYKLDNKQVMYNLDKQDMTGYFENMKELYEYTQKKNIDFLYVQLPFKIQNDEVMPLGGREFGNDNADALVSMMRNENIPVLDIRDNIEQNRWKHEDLFFDTDHHWKPSTALWAAGIIVDELNTKNKFAVNEKIYDIKNYNVETYEDWFLGSLGKRTGNWYSGVDDFDIITPEFETDFDFYAMTTSGDEYREGSFEDVMFKRSFIDEKDYFDLNTYAGYIGGDYMLNEITNNMAPNDKKVLLLRDSFSCAMLPYLSLSAEEITAIDLRHYQEMSLVEYIEKKDIDMVLIAYNPSAFSQQQFNFKKRYTWQP